MSPPRHGGTGAQAQRPTVTGLERRSTALPI
jgi:hypothetical protein